MYFQIEKLIIWPRNSELELKTIQFVPGIVNVITGASRTGKSAIIPIIDYCLGSGECFIPIDVIRDKASWYGVVVCTGDEKILFARQVPDGKKVSVHFLILRGKEIQIPEKITKSNNNLQGAKYILDSLSKVSYLDKDFDDNSFGKRLGFRDLMHLVFQSQDTIANQNILFYKTHHFANRERLKVWFPFILGAETTETIRAEIELKEVEAKLKQQQKELDKTKYVSGMWLQQLLGQLQKLQEFGVCPQVLPSVDQVEQLQTIAESILKENPNHPSITLQSVETAIQEIQNIEKKEDELSGIIAILKKRLNNLNRLQNCLSDYDSLTEQQVERLGLARWLKENAISANICPMCGSTTHENAHEEIDKICSALSCYEATIPHTKEPPAPISREQNFLRKKLEGVLSEQKNIQERKNILCAQNDKSTEYLLRSKDLFTLLGQLTTTVRFIRYLTDSGGIEEEIAELKERQKELKSTLQSANCSMRKEDALKKVSIIALERLKTLDVEDIFKKFPPVFLIQEFNIQVQGQDGNNYLLSEVGSASNWVSFHIAFNCALQEFFTMQTNPESSVPSFVVFDQPSQVYFPKTRLVESENDDPVKYPDEDVKAVKGIFKTLATSVLATSGKWQVIVLDHAGKDIFDGIDGVEIVAEWRNGNKLIPENWM